MSIEEFETRPPAFWRHMGPFFASKALRKTMPDLSDDDGYVWFLAWNAGQVVGFAACNIDKSNVGHLRHLYVLPGERGNGVSEDLLKARLDYLRARNVKIARSVANVKSLPILTRFGFRETGEKGSYRTVEASL